MFDIGFSELLLFGVIALIVLGPEKLPQAARTAGQWYAKIRRTISTLQSEIEAEFDLAETRQQMQNELAKIRQTEADMRREMAEMRGNIKEFESAQNQNLKPSDDAVNNETRDKANISNQEQGSNKQDLDKKSTHRPNTPKEFDYAYSTDEQDTTVTATEPLPTQRSDNSLDNAVNAKVTQAAQTMITKPWENMWFRLGAYDKARRLPMPPYLPNYKADTLLNSHLNNTLNKQPATNIQEAD